VNRRRHFTSLHHSGNMRPMELTSVSNSRAWYSASIADFRQTQSQIILGFLAANSDFALIPTQRDAWIAEINFLHTSLEGLTGFLFMEFSIPRMGRRIDAVILIDPVVFVVEFKVGEKTFDRVALDQVWDYALDLKNFHEASHAAAIVPILVATEATQSVTINLRADEDNVYRPMSVGAAGFREVVDLAVQRITGCALDNQQWARAPYHPTPTIVDAARCLYAQHSVEAIARHDAGAQNLRVTSRRVEELVDEAREKGHKLICFVTGVPGAGKTLVGLNIATRRREPDQPTHAVFLSGNGPLVAVLREALTRDEVVRRKNKARKSERARLPRVSRHSFRTCTTSEMIN
jgi:schlafen family protein